jgi:hypothetical protein
LIARLAPILLALPLIGLAAADAKVVKVATPQGELLVAQRGSATVLTLRTHRQSRVAILPADEMIAAGTLERARLVGLAGTQLLLLTTYASQTGKGGPQAQCAAGEESVLRIVRAGADVRQTAALRVTSCWERIDEGELSWDPQSQTLKLDSGDDGAPAYTVSPDGQFLKIDHPNPKQP